MDPSILKDLRHLVAANVISEETAANIQEYYRSRAAEPSNRFAIVLGILGALLVGFGIVLVIAHNWDSFPRTIKTIFAFLPLVLGQGLCLYTLFKRKENFVWRESSAIILFFGIGASISLVSQIYHLGGTLSGLLLTWMILAAPLIYILPSYIVSLLYIAGASWYACVLGYSWDRSSEFPYLYLPLILVVVPAYLKLLKAQNNLFHLHNWFLAASVAVVMGTFIEETDFQWGFLGYLMLFSLYYVIGTGKLFRQYRTFANPFLVSAVPAIVLMLLFWSYGLVGYYFTDGVAWHEPFPYLTVVLMVVCLAILIKRYRDDDWATISPVEFSGFIFLIALLVITESGIGSLLIVNLWILALGLYFARRGSRQHNLGTLNLGLLIIASLAVLRFFDSSIPFVWRGIFFLAAGISFFTANYLVIKRKKSLTLKQQA